MQSISGILPSYTAHFFVQKMYTWERALSHPCAFGYNASSAFWTASCLPSSSSILHTHAWPPLGKFTLTFENQRQTLPPGILRSCKRAYNKHSETAVFSLGFSHTSLFYPLNIWVYMCFLCKSGSCTGQSCLIYSSELSVSSTSNRSIMLIIEHTIWHQNLWHYAPVWVI